MKLMYKIRNDSIIVSFYGQKLTFYGSDEIRNKIRALIFQGYFNVVIDLSNVIFLDPSAINVLYSLHRICSRKGGHLSICSPTYDVQMVLSITGIDQYMDVCQNEDEVFATKKENKSSL